MEIKEKLRAYQSKVEWAIAEYLPAAKARPALIHEAMRYSMMAGGKRLRPILVLAASELFASATNPMPAAVAVECLHTYSLIHDDLPALDDADLRRGRPTSHKQFDEATAVLAGDALLTYAFQLLARHYRETPEIAAALIGELAETAGSERLIGGQVEDIAGEGQPLSPEQVEYIHLNKTSALIECCLVMGGLVGRASAEDLDRLRQYGRHIGLAFQIVDDILDATSDRETLGKDTGSDEQKTTYVTLYGLEGAQSLADQQTQSAIELCQQFPGNADLLADLARYLGRRIS